MQSNSHTRWPVLAVCLLCSTPVLALDAGHWYGGVAAGMSKVDTGVADWDDGSISTGQVDNTGFSYNVFAGYGFTRHLGLELNYWRIADTDFHGTSVSIRPSVWVPGQVQGVTEAQGVSVEAVLAWPFGRRLSVFAKGGLFFWDTVIKYFPTVSSQVAIENNQLTLINDNGVQPIFGAGVDLRLSRNWGLRAAWTQSWIGLAKTHQYAVSYPSLGVMANF